MTAGAFACILALMQHHRPTVARSQLSDSIGSFSWSTLCYNADSFSEHQQRSVFFLMWYGFSEGFSQSFAFSWGYRWSRNFSILVDPVGYPLCLPESSLKCFKKDYVFLNTSKLKKQDLSFIPNASRDQTNGFGIFYITLLDSPSITCLAMPLDKSLWIAYTMINDPLFVGFRLLLVSWRLQILRVPYASICRHTLFLFNFVWAIKKVNGETLSFFCSFSLDAIYGCFYFLWSISFFLPRL